jgi:hypothetical protein
LFKIRSRFIYLLYNQEFESVTAFFGLLHIVAHPSSKIFYFKLFIPEFITNVLTESAIFSPQQPWINADTFCSVPGSERELSSILAVCHLPGIAELALESGVRQAGYETTWTALAKRITSS